MKYDRDFLISVHNDIKANMEDIHLKQHHNPGNLISKPKNGSDFFTLRYWRSNDRERLTDYLFNQSCLELLVCNNRLFIGIWFGENNKEFSKRKRFAHDIIEKSKDYPGYIWADENGTPAPTDEKLIQWLCESNHETTFRKELTAYSRDEVLTEMKHLSEYLDILLKKE
ncbi:hypothetical protein [Ruminococcus albus]|uniref:Uncharacterized protein n=1 Tax=Ruminococcus albus TaxID=1264 RepID=A0A1H7Q7C8_RUMAL|nr:hypothetical protein [Ruminococcus albus]SEL43893.1 hypothetical protein SAMN05216469_1314 [Ruminococcus albus]